MMSDRANGACAVRCCCASCLVGRVGGLRSQACRCSRVRRPSGCGSEARGRRARPPRQPQRVVGGWLTPTRLRRDSRPQRPSSPLLCSCLCSQGTPWSRSARSLSGSHAGVSSHWSGRLAQRSTGTVCPHSGKPLASFERDSPPGTASDQAATGVVPRWVTSSVDHAACMTHPPIRVARSQTRPFTNQG